MRVGIGYDVHRLVEGRSLFLGGVLIPFSKGLLGHSDGDVLIHAICDAILGAMSEGDIGIHFPDTDRTTEGIRSVEILSYIGRLAANKGFKIVNIDTVVVTEEPKISPHRERMKEAIADLLGVDKSAIGIKGKTTEGLGFSGRKEGIEAHAVVLLEKERD
ncbi:MAG: 2-C-methyl-D-erythritol 2,4-cyclodiphosphate synthase [Syntrophobacterales bacterium]|jgi:2-C-methyl-D-erythritol 2,4-cyclodiphosphate synthase|nr:2-C-methyl-D-erythritol 2,4-cyclodiphosphate synthase [Syntrophobacterales bacterium]